MNILLIGNYLPDRQESMARYAALVCESLRKAGHAVTLACPPGSLNRASRAPRGVWKWVGYLDKLVLCRRDLQRAAEAADVVHICDHSNAMYVPRVRRRPYVVTCHDLLAVRGALGEATDCPASVTGRYLQRMVLAGLQRADAIACVSRATWDDAKRLLAGYNGRLTVIPNALNYPFRQRDPTEVAALIRSVPGMDRPGPYLLNVGSNLRRKNRDGAMRIVASIGGCWNGYLVFAGEPLNPGLKQFARSLGIADRVVEVAKPSNDVLEALYNGAQALLFPSRFEGFGWPMTEAQACGCPVICGDRAPFPEVSGGAAMLCDLEEEASFAGAVLELAGSSALRADLVQRGLANAAKHQPEAMIGQLEYLYSSVI